MVLLNHLYILLNISDVVVVQSPLSQVLFFATPWTAACQASLSSLSPWVWSNSCLWRQWCYPAISSSVSPCPHSFSVSRSFPMSQLIISGSQSIGASVSIFPMNIQDWFSLRLSGLILLSKGLFLSTTIWKHQFSGAQPSLWFNSHLYMTTRKTTALTILTFADKVIPLLFNMLSSFVIGFLPRSKFLLI